MKGQFETAKSFLLPNEDVYLTCKTRSGLLVFSSRRITVLDDKGPQRFRIRHAIPNDCVLSIESKKKDRFEISGKVLDLYGRNLDGVRSFEVRAPKGEVSQFISEMKQCSDAVEEMRSSGIPEPDLTYLERMPETLTQDAMLDLNTVLRDQPIPNELVHEALKFLGDEPFLIEESLRDGNDRENGVLFAAGSQGYYWIQGKKKGRFMSNVIVDTIEWENFQGFTHQWHNENATIYATYSLTKDGEPITKEHLWNPPINDDTIEYPWFLQERNGPWIMADVSSKYSQSFSPSFMVS